MSENAERRVSPEIIKPTKEVLMVFGQGPVQEYEDKQNEQARTGLNFFSRLNALAAAELLIEGKTDEVIVSGGATGAKKEATEGELMSQAIKKRLQSDIKRQLEQTSDPSTTIHIGSRTYKIRLQDRSPEDIEEDISTFLNSVVRIENQAQDSLENFVNILNMLDADTTSDTHLSFLGIGFHANNKHSGAEMGRLQKLAEIFQLEGAIISAEDVLRDIAKKRRENSFVKSQLQILTGMSENHDVAIEKSRQENLLIQELDKGVWITRVAKMTNMDRIKNIALQNPLLRQKLSQHYNISELDLASKLNTRQLSDIQTDLLTVGQEMLSSEEYKVVNREYIETKKDVFNKLEVMRDARIKAIITDPQVAQIVRPFISDNDMEYLDIEKLLSQLRAEYDIQTQKIIECSNRILELHKHTSDDPVLQQLEKERLDLVINREVLHKILIEDRYKNRSTYLMQYGKGEDMIKREKN